MTRLFTSGLESGSFPAEGLAASGVTVVTDRAKTGTRSMKSTAGDQWASRYFTGVDGRNYYFRANVQLDTLPAAASEKGIYELQAAGAWMNLAVLPAGTLLLAYSGGSLPVSAAVIAMDVWYRVELRVKVNLAADDEVEVKVDGTTVLGPTTVNYANGVIDEQQFGNHNGASAVTWYDDLAINDDQGAVDNSWPGAIPASPQVLRPDADITTTGWATAPLFSKINDSSDATVITGTLA